MEEQVANLTTGVADVKTVRRRAITPSRRGRPWQQEEPAPRIIKREKKWARQGLTRQRLSPRFACSFADFVEAVPESADGHEDSLESLFWLWMDGWNEEDWPFDGDPPEDPMTDIFDQ